MEDPRASQTLEYTARQTAEQQSSWRLVDEQEQVSGESAVVMVRESTSMYAFEAVEEAETLSAACADDGQLCFAIGERNAGRGARA